MRRLIQPSVVISCALLCAAASSRADEWSRKYSVSGKAEVRVITTDGDVTARVGESDSVLARVITTGWKIAPEEVRVTSRQIGDRVELEVRLPHFRWNAGHRSLRIELTVPRQANLDFRTSDGSITAEGIRGEMRLSSGDGNIRASSLDGSLDASTGDGNLTVEGRFERLNLHSGDGHVEARVNSGSRMTSDWGMRSGDGSITLHLPQNFSADLDLHTGDGHIDLGFPLTVSGSLRGNEVHGKLNGGGMSLVVHTGDGSIHVGRI